MSLSLRGLAAGLAVSVVGFSHSTASFGESPDSNYSSRSTVIERDEAAVNEVTAAFDAEIKGDKVARKKWLEAAAQRESTQAIANSQRGLLATSTGEWTAIHEATQQPVSNHWDAYIAKRTLIADTANDHWNLAQWCGRVGLKDQRHAHLHRAIRLDPDHAEARSALKYRRLNNQWMSAEELAESQELVNQVRSSVRKYGAKMNSIASAIAEGNEDRKSAAIKSLNELSDPSIIPALEVAFGQTDAEVTQHALAWLHRQRETVASMSLGRFAILHEDDGVRSQASRYLLQRDLYEFAPSLVEMINAPIRSELMTWFRPDGGAAIREAFIMEGQDQVNTLVLDSEWIPVNRWTGNVNSLRRRDGALANPFSAERERNVRTTATQQVASRSAAMQQRNAAIYLLNQRIASVLSVVAGKTILAEPDAMWKWWDEVNEVERPQLKSTRYVRLYQSTPYDVTPPSGVMLPTSGECFVRGTPVMTRNGFKPIESIRVGDLVLSKQTRTGALSWKPVLETTRREPSPTLSIVTEKDRFQCTGGHVFWVSGRGWIKASQLKVGDVLHGAEEPTLVNSITDAAAATTHNLVVAENANYFVGESLILSHDFTPRAFEPESVPGLSVAGLATVQTP